MANELRVGFVGCGGIATTKHAPAFASVDGVKVVAACDLEIDRARQLASDYGASSYTDLHEMLDKEDLDVVDVVTAEQHRLPPLLACLQAGKHVFCEKTLTGRRGCNRIQWQDVLDAKPVIDAWKKAGTFFGINFNYRTSPPAVLIKEALDDGSMGDIIALNVRANVACWSHVIDLMRWFAGDVAELTAYVNGDDDCPDRSAVLKFASGTFGTLMGSVRFGWIHDLLRVEVVGTKCRAVMTDLCGRAEFFPADPKERVRIWQLPADNRWGEFDRTFHNSCVNYAKAVQAGKEPPVTGTDAIRELEIDAGIFVSAETGKPFKPEHYG